MKSSSQNRECENAKAERRLPQEKVKRRKISEHQRELRSSEQHPRLDADKSAGD
jgi:hypothetical protein